jgi:hypothetical protein
LFAKTSPKLQKTTPFLTDQFGYFSRRLLLPPPTLVAFHCSPLHETPKNPQILFFFVIFLPSCCFVPIVVKVFLLTF